MGMILVTASVAVFVWAVVGLIRPTWARLPSRAASVGVWVLSVVLFIIGGALMLDSTPEQTEQSAEESIAPTGGPVEVAIDFDIERDSRGQLRISGETNLPNETRLIFSLSQQATNFGVQDSGQVQNGRFESAWLGGSLSAGVYEVNITVPFHNAQPASVQRRLGPALEAMTGPLVEQGSLDSLGNVASIQREVEVP